MNFTQQSKLGPVSNFEILIELSLHMSNYDVVIDIIAFTGQFEIFSRTELIAKFFESLEKGNYRQITIQFDEN